MEGNWEKKSAREYEKGNERRILKLLLEYRETEEYRMKASEENSDV